MLFDVTSAAQTLEDLLDHERRMILSGKVAELERFTHQKERLVSRLAQLSDVGALTRIRRKAERNQALLSAAASGLRAARDKVGEIGAGSAPMRTYGADGAAREIVRTRKKDGINHRA